MIGGCNDTAKRKTGDLIRITESFHQDVSRWKKHYGLRVIGETVDGKKVINGLDVYKMMSSQGIDLELMLLHIDSRKHVVDWLGFAKAATVEDWLMSTIIRKISYPITEVYGERYWLEVRNRLAIWFVQYMDLQ